MKTFHSFIVLIFLSACSLPTETLTPTASGILPITQSVLPTSTSSPTNTITPKPSPTASATTTQTTEPIPTTEPTLTPEPTKTISEITNLDQIPVRSVQCIDERLCYHMRVKEDKQEEAWKQVISSFAVSPMLKDYWKDLGINDPNPENVEEFLANNVGGPENSAYWLPSETPNGIPFVMLQGRTRTRSMFDAHKQINENGGVYLDRMAFAAFSVDDWKNNQGLNGWVSNLMEKNYRGNPKYLNRGSSCYLTQGDPAILFGLNFNMGRFTFIIGHEKIIDADLAWQDLMELGGVKQVFRPDFDPKIAQAYWDTYWILTSEWDDSLKYENQQAYIIPLPGAISTPLVNVLSIEETIFEPIE